MWSRSGIGNADFGTPAEASRFTGRPLPLVMQSFQRGQDSGRAGVHSHWRHITPVDNALGVDYEQGSFGCAVTGAVYAVKAGDFPFRFKVGQKGKMQFALEGDDCVTPYSVHVDSQKFG